ncbi:MAG: hypothetical protein HY822_16885 [Acidobacteria bacterium]|nr:hypothetical protein [Acidobacteriota bacterium]
MNFHHLGIPTEEAKGGEQYLEKYKLFHSGYETSPYGVEWMRFEPGCPLPELVQRIPHVAFEVEDLEAAIAGQEVLIPPNSPSPGVRVAFVVHNGAPIEFLEFGRRFPTAEEMQREDRER